MGKETEQVFESRGMEDITNDVAAEFDLSVGLAGIIPVPQFSLIPSYSYIESKMYSHVTNKIIQYPAVLKRTTTYADGSILNLYFLPTLTKSIITTLNPGIIAKGIPIKIILKISPV